MAVPVAVSIGHMPLLQLSVSQHLTHFVLERNDIHMPESDLKSDLSEQSSKLFVAVQSKVVVGTSLTFVNDVFVWHEIKKNHSCYHIFFLFKFT